jgi:hypothetical protein
LKRFEVHAVVVLAAVAVLAKPVGAQWGLWPADSLLAEGRLATAESAYYAATRAHPRDPLARAALGRFLAARGGVKAGAVLLEEAQFFGGDSAALARSLVPLYERLRDYRALAELKPSVLSAVERRRAAWLASRPSEARLRDTVVLLTYRPVGDGRGFGTVMLRVGRSELAAVIDPRVTGVLLPGTMRRDVRVFGNHGGRAIAVADSIRIGSIAFFNVPVSLGSPDDAVRVGFDVLAPYYPGFDPGRSLLTLRRVQRRAPPLAGVRVPALYDDNGMRLLLGAKWQATTSAMPAMLLATRKWMWDWKLGDVVLSPDDAATPP